MTYHLVYSCRIALGLLFIYAAVGKFIDPSRAVQTLNVAFNNSPDSMAFTNIVLAVTFVELICGILIITKRNLNTVLAVTFILVMIFTVILAGLYFKGDYIQSCGCFGAFGEMSITWSLFKNLLILFCVLIIYQFENRNIVSEPGIHQK